MHSIKFKDTLLHEFRNPLNSLSALNIEKSALIKQMSLLVEEKSENPKIK
jgi:hypothetical protein